MLALALLRTMGLQIKRSPFVFAWNSLQGIGDGFGMVC
jgi:hypothetical protein